MNRLIGWFAANGVAANLLMVVIMVAGLIAAPRVKREVFPEFSTDTVSVSVVYPGASPEEVEESINVRIEEKVAGLDGVKRITSTAAEGAGAVTIEALAGFDVRELLDDVKSQVDSIDTFPVEAEEPVVSEIIARNMVLNVAVFGDADERSLKRLAERVRDDLTAMPEISLVELGAVRPYEISIEVDEQSLRRWGLSFDQVADAVRRSSLDLPGGSVRTDAGEVLLRTKGQAYTAGEFEKLVLLTRSDGTRLLLGDVARIVDGFEETDQSARFNGKPAAMVQVFRVGEQSALEVAAVVRNYLETMQPRMPEGISLQIWRDSSAILQDRIDTLRRNGLQGLVLVFVTLALFLQLRLALWVTLGIPLSFLGALWTLPYLDVSINMMSLFCFILVLGIVVDDAIVIGENVYRKKEDGLQGLEAVTRGAQEVAVPVIFGVLTTVAAFGAMLGLPGASGKIMRVFPATVIPALLFSLLESQLILPAHLRHVVVSAESGGRGLSRRWKRLQESFSVGLDVYIRGFYQPLLNVSLDWRYATIAGAFSLVIITMAMAASGRVPLSYFPNVEADNVVALLTMPRGTPSDSTAEVVRRIEAEARAVERELVDELGAQAGAFPYVATSVGEQPYRTAQSHNGGRAGGTFLGAHLGEVIIQLPSPALRSYAAAEVQRRWRERVGSIPEAVELTYTSSLFSAGAAIDVRFSGDDPTKLLAAAVRLKAALAAYPGVFDVADSFRPGKQELKLSIRPEAEASGLTLADLARQTRQGFYGEEAQRVQRGREDIKVMVRYPEEHRRSLRTLESMRVRTPSGVEVPFSQVAEVEQGRGYATIERADRRRVIDVTADVDPAVANANQIMAVLRTGVLAEIAADYPQLRYSLEGEQREQRETLATLARSFGVALLVIYALMAVPLKSYLQPLIVMTAIPVGVVGAIWAHLLLGMDVSFLSIFGIVALVGVVVNDSLVLVDWVNRHRQEYDSVREVVGRAGAARFRAILLTSLTTFAGLVPLLLERSLQAQFLVPMAVSLGFGVIFATGVSLVLVPCTYLVLEDLRGYVERRLGRRAAVVSS